MDDVATRRKRYDEYALIISHGLYALFYAPLLLGDMLDDYVSIMFSTGSDRTDVCSDCMYCMYVCAS